MFCAILIFPIPYPVNAEVTIQNLRGIIFFEIIKPEKILPLLGINMTVEELLGMAKGETVASADGVDSANSL